MITTGVDSNVIIDILESDPNFVQASKKMLDHCLAEGDVVACDAVWAEVMTAYQKDVDSALQKIDMLGITYSSLSLESALEAARRWYEYRQQGGTRKRIATDFLIGAHATVQCDRLLNRDRGVYRQYFKSLNLLDPTESSSKSENGE